MKRAGATIVAIFLAVAAHGQTRIATDIEIRQMEEEARRASSFEGKVTARVNLGWASTKRPSVRRGCQWPPRSGSWRRGRACATCSS